MRAAFSNIHFSVRDPILADGDMVCLIWSCTVTHSGNGLGIPATNKNLQTTGITVVRIANGKIVAGWQNWDMLGLIQQIRDEPMSPTYIAGNKTAEKGAALNFTLLLLSKSSWRLESNSPQDLIQQISQRAQ